MKKKKITAIILAGIMAVGMSFPAHAAGKKTSTLDGIDITGETKIEGLYASGYTTRSTLGNVTVKMTYECVLVNSNTVVTKTKSQTKAGTMASVRSTEDVRYMLSVNGEHTMTVNNGTKVILYT